MICRARRHGYNRVTEAPPLRRWATLCNGDEYTIEEGVKGRLDDG